MSKIGNPGSFIACDYSDAGLRFIADPAQQDFPAVGVKDDIACKFRNCRYDQRRLYQGKPGIQCQGTANVPCPDNITCIFDGYSDLIAKKVHRAFS